MRASKRDPRVYVDDILSAIAKIEKYTMDGKPTFLTDEQIQDAVIYQVMIMGEASSKLPSAMKAKHLEIPWKKIVGMRNILIHEYAEVMIQRVWDVVEHDLPPLKQVVQLILQEIA